MATTHNEKSPRTAETLCDPGLPTVTAIEAETLDGKGGRYGLGPRSTQVDKDAHSFDHSTIVGEEDVERSGSTPQRIITPIRPTVKVPRSKRRGLFARFALIAEVTHPQDYDRRTKWFITFIVAFSAAAAPAGSSIFFPALDQVAADLNTTPTITNL